MQLACEVDSHYQSSLSSLLILSLTHTHSSAFSSFFPLTPKSPPRPSPPLSLCRRFSLFLYRQSADLTRPPSSNSRPASFSFSETQVIKQALGRA
ncbi:hypothetical protein S83_033827 [Arachis hypogaea]